MATTQRTVSTGTLPPYLPFKTFQSAVQNLRAHGLPGEKLDKTTWHSRSSVDQASILGAFKFLGLVDETEHVQPILKKLVDATENSEQEKVVLSGLLRNAYVKAFEINLKTATPGQLDEAIASLGVTGATRDRAVRFFLKAATHCGFELSSRLTAGLRSRSESAASGAEDNEAATSGTPRPRRRRRSNMSEHDEEPSGEAVKTIPLKTGELTLSGTFNPFELDTDERKLVYDIIDLMKQHEDKGKKTDS
jgi:hypothetical protein